MQIQGSGLIRLPDGKGLRIGFAGKNGHPYTSIGKILIERGILQAAGASLQTVLDWMRADPERGRKLMWENKSYPFFQVLEKTEHGEGPHGALGLPLTPGRSLAVDPRYHQLGLPIWISAPELKDSKGASRRAADDRAGYGLGHTRPSPRRHFLGQRRQGRAHRRRNQTPL